MSASALYVSTAVTALGMITVLFCMDVRLSHLIKVCVMLYWYLWRLARRSNWRSAPPP